MLQIMAEEVMIFTESRISLNSHIHMETRQIRPTLPGTWNVSEAANWGVCQAAMHNSKVPLCAEALNTTRTISSMFL